MKSFLLLFLLLASCTTIKIKPRTFQLPIDFNHYKAIDTIKVGNTNMVLLKDPSSGNKYLVDQSTHDVHTFNGSEWN